MPLSLSDLVVTVIGLLPLPCLDNLSTCAIAADFVNRTETRCRLMHLDISATDIITSPALLLSDSRLSRIRCWVFGTDS